MKALHEISDLMKQQECSQKTSKTYHSLQSLHNCHQWLLIIGQNVHIIPGQKAWLYFRKFYMDRKLIFYIFKKLNNCRICWKLAHYSSIKYMLKMNGVDERKVMHPQLSCIGISSDSKTVVTMYCFMVDLSMWMLSPEAQQFSSLKNSTSSYTNPVSVVRWLVPVVGGIHRQGPNNPPFVGNNEPNDQSSLWLLKALTKFHI